MRTTVLFILIIAGLFLINFTKAQTETPSAWIKPGGCNLTACGSTCAGTFECPLSTIQQGLDALGGGRGSVILYMGTYEGEGNANISLSGAEVTISSGQGIQSATIDCGGRPGFSLSGGTARFIGLVVNNCQRPNGNGGAFYERYGYIQLDTVKVTNSHAIRGGALYVESGSANTYRSYLTNNTASETGGGAFIYNGTLTLTESNTSGNQPNDVACSGAEVQVFRPIEVGVPDCGSGCSSSICSSA